MAKSSILNSIKYKLELGGEKEGFPIKLVTIAGAHDRRATVFSGGRISAIRTIETIWPEKRGLL